MSTSNYVLLSIVINTYKRPDYLLSLIESLNKLDLSMSHEIIVVDDNSDNFDINFFKSKFPEIKFYQTPYHYYLIKSRNLGWSKSSGKIICFIDDDNEIFDKEFFKIALGLLDANSKLGVLGARTYYFDHSDIILIGGSRFNYYTGKTTLLDINSSKVSSADLIDTYDCPNCFFTYREILESVGGFSEEIVQTCSEADFCMRVRKQGFKIKHSPLLKVFHKSPIVDYSSMSLRYIGGSPKRAYYLMRNRYLMIKRYGTWIQKITFIFIFHWLFIAFYSFVAIKLRAWDFLRSIILGSWHGIYYLSTGNLLNRL